MMKEPTQRQKDVLNFITGFIRTHSYPPTIREIGAHFLISAGAAYDHVTALKRKGLIKIEDKRSRTMELTNAGWEQERSDTVEVPILGVVAAGRPILVEENWDGFIPIHKSLLNKSRQYFALKVRGDSMKDAGILDEDTALIQKQQTAKNGDIVVAVVDDEAVTLKRFFLEKNAVRLQPENASFKPIRSRNVRVLGKLSYVIRSY
jgi:repressor LexA